MVPYPYLGLLLDFEASFAGNSTKKETALSLLDLLPVGVDKKKFTRKLPLTNNTNYPGRHGTGAHWH